MAKPLRVLDMEYVDEVWDYGGRPMRAMKITFDRESTERIRNGYACAKCLAVFDRAWPVNCPECGAPVRARQAEFLAREYGGVENYVRSWDEEFERLARRGHQLRKPVSIAVKGEVMSDSTTKTETKKAKAAKADEPKLTLPAGHPEAGYYPPDLSYRSGAGTSDEEEAGLEEQIADRDELVAAVEEHEHEVATAEREATLAEEPEAAPKK